LNSFSYELIKDIYGFMSYGCYLNLFIYVVDFSGQNNNKLDDFPLVQDFISLYQMVILQYQIICDI